MAEKIFGDLKMKAKIKIKIKSKIFYALPVSKVVVTPLFSKHPVVSKAA